MNEPTQITDAKKRYACGDQVRAKKPAPDIYQLALTRLGLGADQAVAFEDSLNGLRAAMTAGLWTVVTPTFWTEGSDFTTAGLVLPRLGDPSQPLEGEPGGELRSAAWLTFGELGQRAAPLTVASQMDAHGRARRRETAEDHALYAGSSR